MISNTINGDEFILNLQFYDDAFIYDYINKTPLDVIRLHQFRTKQYFKGFMMHFNINENTETQSILWRPNHTIKLNSITTTISQNLNFINEYDSDYGSLFVNDVPIVAFHYVTEISNVLNFINHDMVVGYDDCISLSYTNNGTVDLKKKRYYEMVDPRILSAAELAEAQGYTKLVPDKCVGFDLDYLGEETYSIIVIHHKNTQDNSAVAPSTFTVRPQFGKYYFKPLILEKFMATKLYQQLDIGIDIDFSQSLYSMDNINKVKPVYILTFGYNPKGGYDG